MTHRSDILPKLASAALAVALVWSAPVGLGAQESLVDGAVTFSKDIAPDPAAQLPELPSTRRAVAPMSLITYQEVRRWAARIRERTAIRDRMGAMPPWYVEKDIGIQHYKHDPSLSDEELALIAGVGRGGAARATRPTCRADRLGRLAAGRSGPTSSSDRARDRGGGRTPPTGGARSRACRFRSMRTATCGRRDPGGQRRGTRRPGRARDGGRRYVVHHMIWNTAVPGTRRARHGWPVHEVGPQPRRLRARWAGRLLKAGSQRHVESVHLHSNGRTTTATLEIGFELFPEGYEPKYQGNITPLANGTDIDIGPNEAGQELDAYMVVSAPRRSSASSRTCTRPASACASRRLGLQGETLSCVGYDHNWVRTYVFDDNYQPLLPPGHVLHIRGYMNNSETNPNVPDPRNWQGSGNRSRREHVHRPRRARDDDRGAVLAGGA
jgi:hypothetical protein